MVVHIRVTQYTWRWQLPFEIQINGSYGINVTLVHLWHAADSRSRVAGNPVQEEGGEPLLKKDGGAGEKVADGFSFLLPSVSRQCRAQFPLKWPQKSAAYFFGSEMTPPNPHIRSSQRQGCDALGDKTLSLLVVGPVLAPEAPDIPSLEIEEDENSCSTFLPPRRTPRTHQRPELWNRLSCGLLSSCTHVLLREQLAVRFSIWWQRLLHWKHELTGLPWPLSRRSPAQGWNRVLVSLISWPGQLLSLNPCRRPKILARMLFGGILSLTVVILEITAFLIIDCDYWWKQTNA